MAETAKSKAQAEQHLDELEQEMNKMRTQVADERAHAKGVVKDVSDVLESIAESHNFYDSQRMAAEALEWLKKV